MLITVSPNPATTSLTITASEKIETIAISNLLGQTLYTCEYNSQQVHIDITNFPKGVYFVKVNGLEIRKFVKE
jgi:hypothetical protein